MTAKMAKTEQTVAMCQHPGCNEPARMKRDGTPYKYCRVHGAASRKRFVAMLEQNKAEREKIRTAHLDVFKGRVCESGGFLVRTMRSNSALANDLLGAGIAVKDSGNVVIRVSNGRSHHTIVATINAALVKSGAKDTVIEMS